MTPLDTLDLGAGRALAVVADDSGGLRAVPVVSDGGSVRRAAPGDGVAEGLLTLLAGGDRVEGRYRVRRWRGSEASGERGVGVDQTNESVIVGAAAVVKWVTDVSVGPHPAPSLLELLEAAGFTGMPQPWGVVEWSPSPEEQPRLLAIVAEYVDGAVDGWTWAVEDVRAGRLVEAGQAVGALVADFHRALARTARPATADEVTAWRAGALADLERALEVTEGAAHDVLVRHADAVRAAFDEIPEGGPVLRVHGDLHVGQVLRAGGSAVRLPADRLRRQPRGPACRADPGAAGRAGRRRDGPVVHPRRHRHAEAQPGSRS